MLTAYLAERLPLTVFLPVAAILAFAGSAARWPGLGAFAAATGFALLLVAQFRMWDDLADRDRDAVTKPHRVLQRSGAILPVAIAAVVLGAANCIVVAWRHEALLSVGILLGLNAGMALWYARRGARNAAGDHLLLAKYPVFVVILAGPSIAAAMPARMLLAMATVYLGACVYEAWHDPSSPLARRPALVASETILLVMTVGMLSFGGRS